jgi:predicted phosphodiesterase
MRALILSDIHSNLQALEPVLTAAPTYDAVWNLGDVVGYNANPNEVVNLARTMVGIVVRGNHDRACSKSMKPAEYQELSSLAKHAAAWTEALLESRNAKWLSNLNQGPIRPLGNRVACVHGSPRNEDEYVFFRYDAHAAFRKSRARIIFCGHTHWQAGWSWNRGEIQPLKPDFRSVDGAVRFDLSLQSRHRYILNPGLSGNLATAIGGRHSRCTTMIIRCSPGSGYITTSEQHRGESERPNFPKSLRVD